LCQTGFSVINFSGSGPWTWNCQGLNGGDNSPQCSANKSSGTPDLGFPVLWGYVSGITSQSGGDNGAPFSETLTIVNTGNAPAGSFKVKIWISVTPTINSNSQLLGTWDVPGLAAGGQLTYTFSNLVFSGLGVHSVYYLVTKIDADNQIAETNEADCFVMDSYGNFFFRATVGCNKYAQGFAIYR